MGSTKERLRQIAALPKWASDQAWQIIGGCELSTGTQIELVARIAEALKDARLASLPEIDVHDEDTMMIRVPLALEVVAAVRVEGECWDLLAVLGADQDKLRARLQDHEPAIDRIDDQVGHRVRAMHDSWLEEESIPPGEEASPLVIAEHHTKDQRWNDRCARCGYERAMHPEMNPHGPWPCEAYQEPETTYKGGHFGPPEKLCMDLQDRGAEGATYACSLPAGHPEDQHQSLDSFGRVVASWPVVPRDEAEVPPQLDEGLLPAAAVATCPACGEPTCYCRCAPTPPKLRWKIGHFAALIAAEHCWPCVVQDVQDSRAKIVLLDPNYTSVRHFDGRRAELWVPTRLLQPRHVSCDLPLGDDIDLLADGAFEE